MSGIKEDPRIGLATLVIKDGQILVGYDGEKRKFSFPGGHWDGDINQESFEEGAAREVFEETGGYRGIENMGVQCDNFHTLYDYTFLRRDNNTWYRSIGFTANYLSGELGDDPSEQRTSWRFMEPDDAIKLDLFEPAKYGLEIYIANLKKS